MLNQIPTDFGIPAESQFQGFGITDRFATFVLAQQPLTRFLLTQVRMDSVANLEAKGELGGQCPHDLSG